jgi:hypothetical protein
VVLDALAIDPRRRLASAGEFLDALAEFQPSEEERASLAVLLDDLYDGSFVPDESGTLARLPEIIAGLEAETERTMIYAQAPEVPPTVILPRAAVPAPKPRARRRRRSRAPAFALAGIAAAVAVAAVAALIARWPSATVAPAPLIEAKPIGPPKVSPLSPPPSPEVERTPEEPPAKKVAVKPRPSAPEEEKKAPPASSTPPDVRRLARELTDRVVALRSKRRGAEAELDAILADISLESISADAAGSRSRLEKIEERIAALER